MKKYIFPINYDYSWKWLGLIEYRLLLPISIIGVIIFCIVSLFNLSFFQKSGIFITIFIPIILFLNTSFNHEPAYIFLYCVISHKLTSRKYVRK